MLTLEERKFGHWLSEEMNRLAHHQFFFPSKKRSGCGRL